MLGLQEHNTRQNLRKILMHIKFHISVLLIITTFFTIATFISENGLYFADFFSLSNDSCLLVRHDKHVYKMNSNKRKMSCYSLKFPLESLLSVGIYKTLKFILI